MFISNSNKNDENIVALYKYTLLLVAISFISLILQLYNTTQLPRSKELIFVPHGLNENVNISRGKYSENYLKGLTTDIGNFLLNKSYKTINENHQKLLPYIYYESIDLIKMRFKAESENYITNELESRFETIEEPMIKSQLLKGEIKGVVRYYRKGKPFKEDKVKLVLTFNDVDSLLLENYELFVFETRLLLDETKY